MLIGADAAGQKMVLAVASGQRESTESWAAVLRDVKRRGLRAPKLTIADGHLGIWSALAAVYPERAEQRCWNHKLRNVLDAVPKKHQAEVKAALQEIASAESARAATALRDTFARTYRRPYPKAVERLAHDWERMIAYYAFPQEHWKHLRTTNVIESPFAAVPRRRDRAAGVASPRTISVPPAPGACGDGRRVRRSYRASTARRRGRCTAAGAARGAGRPRPRAS